MTPPVMILALARSFTSVGASMLGEHPDLFAVPELNLFTADTIDQWLAMHGHGRALHAHGLVRTVAHLYFGEQTEEAAALARRWIRHRRGRGTASVYYELVATVHPRALVDKSPLNTGPAALLRLARAFPQARYIRLTRDPEDRARSLRALCARLGIDLPESDAITQSQVTDERLKRFLADRPAERVRWLPGEDLLGDPERVLRELTAWLGLRNDEEAIERMLHPERSPFACVGPPSVPLGNDPDFLRNPQLRRRGSSSGVADPDRDAPLDHAAFIGMHDNTIEGRNGHEGAAHRGDRLPG